MRLNPAALLLVSVALLNGCSTQRSPASSSSASSLPVASKWDDCERPSAAAEEFTAEAGGAGEVGEGMDAPSLRITIFSIGQADAMLLVAGEGTSRKSMLIDLGEPTGRKGRITDEANYEVLAPKLKKRLGGKFIDYFVLSHYHGDHAGPYYPKTHRGIFGLVEHEGFKIGTFLHPGDGQESHFGDAPRAVYKKIKNILPLWKSAGKVKTVTEAEVGQIYKLSDSVEVRVVASDGKVSEDDAGTLAEIAGQSPNVYETLGPPSENDLSVALVISDGNFEMFTAGDLSGASDADGDPNADYTYRQFGDNVTLYSNVEKRLVPALLAQTEKADVEVYRANHHGSGNSSIPALVDALDPEFVVYSCGGDHGHPAQEVVERVDKTAWQYVTSRLDAEAWASQSDFESTYRADVVDRDLEIVTGAGGLWYTIDGELHQAYNYNEEANQQDVGEEETLWE
jgi:beta-lactamase superfamily II metal-dependent hydrolase